MRSVVPEQINVCSGTNLFEQQRLFRKNRNDTNCFLKTWTQTSYIVSKRSIQIIMFLTNQKKYYLCSETHEHTSSIVPEQINNSCVMFGVGLYSCVPERNNIRRLYWFSGTIRFISINLFLEFLFVLEQKICLCWNTFGLPSHVRNWACVKPRYWTHIVCVISILFQNNLSCLNWFVPEQYKSFVFKSSGTIKLTFIDLFRNNISYSILFWNSTFEHRKPQPLLCRYFGLGEGLLHGFGFGVIVTYRRPAARLTKRLFFFRRRRRTTHAPVPLTTGCKEPTYMNQRLWLHSLWGSYIHILIFKNCSLLFYFFDFIFACV